MDPEAAPSTPASTPLRPTRAMALLNQKGGVGKTTTTVNLAAALAKAGRRTLLIDMDPQAHSTLHLGIEPGEQDTTIYDVLLDPLANATSAVVEARENLDLYPSEVDLAAVETELALDEDRQGRLRKALQKLQAERGAYDFILIDCPPSLGLLTLNALAAAREVLIPMQAHFLALQGVGKLLETVHLVCQRINPTLRVAGVALCMHDDNTNLSKEVVADIEAFFAESEATEKPWAGAKVYQPAIRRHIKLAECPSFGQTIFEYAPDKAGAKDYAALAKAIMDEWDAFLAHLAPKNASPTAIPEAQASSASPTTTATEPAPEIVVLDAKPTNRRKSESKRRQKAKQ